MEVQRNNSKRLLQQQSTLMSGEIDKKTGKQQLNLKPVIEKIDPENIFEDKDTELIDTPIIKVEDSEENALTYDVIKRNK